MTVFFIGLGLIIYSNLYTLLLKILRVKSSSNLASLYALLGILATSIAVYFNFKTSSTGEFIVYLMCILGAIVRIGYAHFMSQKSVFQN